MKSAVLVNIGIQNLYEYVIVSCVDALNSFYGNSAPQT